MHTFLKVGVPVITVIIICIIAFFMFKPDATTPATSSHIGDSSSCNIKFQPAIKQYQAYPAMCIDKNKTYTAVIHTSLGDITMDLLAKNAPKTVNSFVFLAKSGFYNNLIFHRIIPGFVIQGGDPKGNGTGGPGYTFADEINPDTLGLNSDQIKNNEASGYVYDHSLQTVKFVTGIVGMANSGPNTNGSQFFITLDTQSQLDGSYTPFAQVTSGMDVVNTIAQLPTDPNAKPNNPPVIKSIEITEKLR